MPKQSVTSEHPTAPPATDPPRRQDSPEPHSSGLAIIGSKVGQAAPARSILARPRLVDWFEQHARARLIVLSAEAGYGKTTLLGEFANHTRDRVVWYRLERSDGDWITFLSYLVAALRDVWPDFGKPTEALLRNVAAMGSTQEVVMAQFLADLSTAEAGRIAVILDDYHLVDQSPDVRMIVSRMLERAPEGMYLVLSGRGTPTLSIGRLRGQGRVSTLNIDDLRFTLAEIEQLFAATYGQPLDDDACRIIAERTEGWAAGLQLVAASISVSRPEEVSDFIAALSGATGPIYDFLAEEVLTRLSPDTQRVLMHASLIERVESEYVSVALEAGGTPVDLSIIEASLDRADSLGLLGVRSMASRGRRLQALFREFLQVHLEREVPTERIEAMHLAIAQVSELDDWLMSARHYSSARSHDDAMRVIGSAAGEALGTGAWGAAVEIVDTMPSTDPPAAVKVIQARALIGEDDERRALEILSGIDRSALSPEERGLVGLTWAAVHHMNGERAPLYQEVSSVAGDPEVPFTSKDVAASWQLVVDAMSGGCITDVVRSLKTLVRRQKHASLEYFAGVSLHNLAFAELSRGNYLEAIEFSRDATRWLEKAQGDYGIAASTLSIEAAAIAELGNLEEGLRIASLSATEQAASADAIADAAYMHAVCGRTSRARSLLTKYERGDSRWARELGAYHQGFYARIAVHLSDGAYSAARSEFDVLDGLEYQAIDAPSRTAVLRATLAVLEGMPSATEAAQEAMAIASSQHAWRWMARARILDAVSSRDGDSLATWISEAESESALALLEMADVISSAIGLVTPLPPALERSILREPARWVSALGRHVAGTGDDARAAASLVARFGTADDAEILRRFEMGSSGRPKKRGLTGQLIRRISPTVRIHDLGLSSYQVGNRSVALADTRRKSAALLLFLVTRPDLAANREQAMEAMWPDQTPKSALNSLHQTIFYLRRELEPWYEDGLTADYVHMDAELVRLDRDLFQVDSIAFARQAAEIIRAGAAVERGPEMLALYRGPFAPEFEYEEWAAEWRTHLHTTYLRLAHCTASEFLRQRRFGEAVEILTPVATIDPSAFDIRATLVGSLAASGASDAAMAHYRSLAAAHERELGLPVRAYEEIIATVSSMS
ncbi:MAG: BTAD domain-containing putative transcriptional regulator [Candidatus Limnocylindrales bacterium]